MTLLNRMHPRTAFGIFIFMLAVVAGALHHFAFRYFLYWRYWWFDNVVHCIFGFLIASTVLWLIAFEVPLSVRGRIPRFVAVFVLTLLVALLWEAFEFVAGIPREANYIADTLSDIVMGMIGMLAARASFRVYGY